MSSQEELEIVDQLKDKLTMSSELPTTEEMNKRKERDIARQSSEQDYQLTEEETIMIKGKQIVTKLIYNTKKGDIDGGAVRKYKTSMCKNHPNCPYGTDCNFAHGEEELKAYEAIQECIVEYYEQAKTGKLDHHELCQNQHCPVRLRLLLQKTVICGYWEERECYKEASSCSYAHGKEELRPLPKYELCASKEGHLKSSECVYAHGKKELRRKGAQEVRPSDSKSDNEAPVDQSDAETWDDDDDDDNNKSSQDGKRNLCDSCASLSEKIPEEHVLRCRFFAFSPRH